MAVTIKDVALKAGVSRAAVSLALNEGSVKKHRLADDTVALIRKTANELGYRPNRLAAGLKKHRTNMIGVLISRLDIFSDEVLRGIKKEIFPEFIPLLALHEFDGVTERKELETLMDNRVDGVIAAFSGDPGSIETYRQLHQEYNIPLVLIDRNIPGLDLPILRFDHYNASYLATKSLQGLGHRRIHFIIATGSVEILEGTRLREKGYRDAMNEAGLGDNIRVTIKQDRNIWNQKNLNGYAAQLTEDWRQRGQSAETVFLADNDFIAYAIMDRCFMKGISIPGDVSVMGIGDHPFSSMEMVGLSTVKIERDGRPVARMLLKLIDKQKLENTEVILPVEVVLRKTTRRI